MILGQTYEDASLRVFMSVSRMDAYTYKLGDVEQERQRFGKPYTVVDDDFVLTGWYSSRTGDFYITDFVLKRPTEVLTINGELADGGLTAEDFSL